MNCAQTSAHNYKHKYIRTSSHGQRNILHVCRFPPETEFSLSLNVHLLNDIRVIKMGNLRRSCSRKDFICLQSLIQTTSRSQMKMEIAVEMAFPSASLQTRQCSEGNNSVLVSTTCVVLSLGLITSATYIKYSAF